MYKVIVPAALTAASAGLAFLPYGWAHMTAGATSAAATAWIGYFAYQARKS